MDNLYRGNGSITEEQSLDFMKDVVKFHGTNTTELANAVNAVADFNGEYYAGNMIKLLTDTAKKSKSCLKIMLFMKMLIYLPERNIIFTCKYKL